jgi:hypothetical protein
MTMNDDLLKAILALDAYNREYNPGIVFDKNSDAAGIQVKKQCIAQFIIV